MAIWGRFTLIPSLLNYMFLLFAPSCFWMKLYCIASQFYGNIQGFVSISNFAKLLYNIPDILEMPGIWREKLTSGTKFQKVICKIAMPKLTSWWQNSPIDRLSNWSKLRKARLDRMQRSIHDRNFTELYRKFIAETVNPHQYFT